MTVLLADKHLDCGSIVLILHLVPTVNICMASGSELFTRDVFGLRIQLIRHELLLNEVVVGDHN
jgi:hypothetical protein